LNADKVVKKRLISILAFKSDNESAKEDKDINIKFMNNTLLMVNIPLDRFII
jgi:hypothetical protein